MKKIFEFLSDSFQFLEVKFSIYLNRRVFVMLSAVLSAGNSNTFPTYFRCCKETLGLYGIRFENTSARSI